MTMDLLGKVVQVLEDKVVVEVSQLPKLRKKVYDKKEKFVGTVVDYFGPTKKPFVVVSTKIHVKVGDNLYGS